MSDATEERLEDHIARIRIGYSWNGPTEEARIALGADFDLMIERLASPSPDVSVPTPSAERIAEAIKSVAEHDPDSHDFISPAKAAAAVLDLLQQGGEK